MSNESCNLHGDCKAADEAVREVRGMPEGATHCHDPNCKAPGCMGGGGLSGVAGHLGGELAPFPSEHTYEQMKRTLDCQRIDVAAKAREFKASGEYPLMTEGDCTHQFVGVATGPQPPHVPDPLRCPPGSELAAFAAMLDRAGVYHDHCQDGDGSEIDISPDSEFAPGRTSPALRGDSWGSASFHFDASGTLIYVNISGD